MKKTLKWAAISLMTVCILMVVPGCTPGKAQTRGNDYKGSFETEEFNAYDNSGSVNDDEIPAYRDNQKVSSGRDNQSGKEYDNSIAKIKKDYDRNNNSGEGYNDARGGAYRDSESSGRDYNNRENSGYNDENANCDKFYQKGMASWYGREFQGRATASGEKFDMNNLTAAHKTLPFGSIVEVKNLSNGKTVRLKINDRGPYRGNRIIDLSYGAARELEMVGAGETLVGINVIKMGNKNSAVENDNNSRYVEPVSDEDYPSTRVKSGSSYDDAGSGDMKLQAGAFLSRKNAENLKSKIEGLTDKPVRIIQDRDLYKVRVEGFRNKNELNKVRDTLDGDNIKSFSVE